MLTTDYFHENSYHWWQRNAWSHFAGEFREHEVVVAGLPEADITDAAGIDAVCRSCKPDVLIHCAAMTDVDKCETCPDMAWKINAVGSAMWPQLASVTVLDSSHIH